MLTIFTLFKHNLTAINFFTIQYLTNVRPIARNLSYNNLGGGGVNLAQLAASLLPLRSPPPLILGPPVIAMALTVASLPHPPALPCSPFLHNIS